ncbi:MAG: T9SS type A sorting domain-containing protein [Marinirhabdus sp.]|nr:T9SS type A sorting domain-containing protein [Marinirhabdus sp.]
MKTTTVCITALLAMGVCMTSVAQQHEVSAYGADPVPVTEENSHLNTNSTNRDVEAYDNGPYFNIPGSPNISRLENQTIGNTTLGAGVSLATGFRLSDDFILADGYEITEITLFGYQTDAPVASSPIEGAYVQIWDGSPDDPASSVIYGDLTTNIMTSSEWSNTYRDSETNAGLTNRGIMSVTCEPSGLILTPGQYWIDWVLEGDLGFSGPWGPPISITGATETGDALQFDPNGAGWAPYLDGGSMNAQGFPFVLNGDLILGVNENPALRSHISIAPNPAQNEFVLSNTSETRLISAEIYTIGGSLLKTIDLSDMNQQITIDSSSLSTGVYMVKINSASGSVAKQLIKR